MYNKLANHDSFNGCVCVCKTDIQYFSANSKSNDGIPLQSNPKVQN